MKHLLRLRRILIGLLRELADENAYQRHLPRTARALGSRVAPACIHTPNGQVSRGPKCC
jgi:hypothetical protein